MIFKILIVILFFINISIDFASAENICKRQGKQLQVIKKTKLSVDHSVAYFGEGGLLGGIFKEAKGACLYRHNHINTSKKEIELSFKKSKLPLLPEIGLSTSWDPKVIRLNENIPEHQAITDLISINCMHYWIGAKKCSDFLRIDEMLNDRLFQVQSNSAELKKIVLIDNPAKVYRNFSTSIASRVWAGETNANDLYYHLTSMAVPAHILTTTVHGRWNQAIQLERLRPSVVGIHFSAFESPGVYLDCRITRNVDYHCTWKLFSLVTRLLKTGAKVVMYTRIPGFCTDQDFKDIIVERLTNQGAKEEEMKRVILFQAKIGGHFGPEDPDNLGGKLASVIKTTFAQNVAEAVKNTDEACLLKPRQ